MEDFGFSVQAQRQTAAGELRLLRHAASGALVVVKADGAEESCLSISFATPAPDDSGLTHVLEHLVFRGARRHPQDQLYTAIRASGVASHLNAATRPLQTSCQIANPLAGDVARLEAVLLDAVFEPRLARRSFLQEACHATPEGRSGVVFNEMTGHFASAEAALEQAMSEALFPDHPQGRAYGGKPQAIAGLRLKDLRAFHKAHYHPAHALVLLSGSAPLGPRLAGLDRTFRRVMRRRSATPGPAPLPEPLPLRGRQDIRVVHDQPCFGLGFRLPQAAPIQLALLGQWVREVLPQASPRSGVILDGVWPSLLLVSGHPLEGALRDLARAVTPFQVETLLCKLGIAAEEGQLDPLLPKGLQGRTMLLGAWSGGRDLLETLDVAGSIAQLRADLPALTQWLRTTLQQLCEGPMVMARSQAGSAAPVDFPTSPRLPPPLARREMPLPALALESLPRHLPRRKAQVEGSITRLEARAGEGARVLIHLAAGDLPPATLGQLPHLAHSLQALAPLGCRVLSELGDRPALVVEQLILGEGHGHLEWLSRVPEAFPMRKAPLPAAAVMARPQLALELRLRAAHCPEAAARDAISGLGHLLAPAPADEGRVRDLWHALCCQSRFRAAHVGGSAGHASRDLQARLPRDMDARKAAPIFHPRAEDEAIALPIALHAVGISARLPEGAAGLSRGALLVALKAIEMHRLWPSLRQEGGAYGVRVALTGRDLVTMITLRDPQGEASLAIMRGSGAWLGRHLDQAMLDQARLAALAVLFAPSSPWQALEQASGADLPWRDEDLAEIVQLDLAAARAAAEVLAPHLACARALVLADHPLLGALGAGFIRKAPQSPP